MSLVTERTLALIPLSDEAKKSNRIKSLSIAKLMATAIKSIHEETSVSNLFV